MKQLGCHWKEFNEICYLITFRNSVENTQDLLKSDNITGTLHEDKSRSVLQNMRCISEESSREYQNTHFMFNSLSSKIVPFVKQCRKKNVVPVRPR
jgi:hypothetical protein